MKNFKRNVRIRLTTVSDGRSSVVEERGEAYVKGSHTYIRYIDTSLGLEGVSTVVKLAPEGVTVLRQGNVRMEQRFVEGKRAAGYYEMQAGSFRLETDTKRVEVRMQDGVGQAVWSYELWISDAEAGTFEVTIDVQEEVGAT